MKIDIGLSEFYEYVFGDRAKINVDKIPEQQRQKKKKEITDTRNKILIINKWKAPFVHQPAVF